MAVETPLAEQNVSLGEAVGIILVALAVMLSAAMFYVAWRI